MNKDANIEWDWYMVCCIIISLYNMHIGEEGISKTSSGKMRINKITETVIVVKLFKLIEEVDK